MVDAPPAAGFGQPVQMFDYSRAAYRDWIRWTIGCFVIAFLAAAAVPVLFVIRPPKEGDVVPTIVLFGFFLLLFLAGGLWSFSMARQTRKNRVWLYNEGLVVTSSRGAVGVRWTDVEELVAFFRRPEFGLMLHGGETIRLSDAEVSRFAELRTAVLDSVLPALTRRMVEDFRAGKTADCGRLQADVGGVVWHRGPFPSGKAHSFYKGPWPLGDFRIAAARAVPEGDRERRFRWDELLGADGDEMEGVYLLTPEETVDLRCGVTDVPNLLALLAIAQDSAKVIGR